MFLDSISLIFLWGHLPGIHNKLLLSQEKDLKQYMDDCGNIMSMSNVKVSKSLSLKDLLMKGFHYHGFCNKWHDFCELIALPDILWSTWFLFLDILISTPAGAIVLPQETSFTSGPQTTKLTHQWTRRAQARWFW